MTPRLLTRFRDDYYAFDKPAGLAVHPGAEGLPDLVTWIRGQRSLPRGLRPGHRLDRATSGLVLCGATGPARAQIAAWLAEARKTYLGLVAGAPESSAGTWDVPLADARRGRPLEARTDYRVLERLGGFTLLELELHTGRKHQLRRHLQGARLPLVGDDRYGPRRPRRVPGFAGRLWLHAWRLELPDRVLEAPLPPALTAHLERLRGSSTK
jgi:23S rRNA pseudouridine955/2504/2580 synthase